MLISIKKFYLLCSADMITKSISLDDKGKVVSWGWFEISDLTGWNRILPKILSFSSISEKIRLSLKFNSNILCSWNISSLFQNKY